jgi:plastocyanin
VHGRERYFDIPDEVALRSALVGRLFAVALVFVVAGIATVIAVGPGDDKPAEREALRPKNESSKTEASLTGESKVGAEGVGATVRMRGLPFVPTTVFVKAGQAVRFVNLDNVVHTVYEDVGARSGINPAFASDRIARGGRFLFAPQNAGTIKYVCTLHPATMSGRIIVSGGEA